MIRKVLTRNKRNYLGVYLIYSYIMYVILLLFIFHVALKRAGLTQG